jgi:hypothetical protein
MGGTLGHADGVTSHATIHCSTTCIHGWIVESQEPDPHLRLLGSVVIRKKERRHTCSVLLATEVSPSTSTRGLGKIFEVPYVAGPELLLPCPQMGGSPVSGWLALNPPA